MTARTPPREILPDTLRALAMVSVLVVNAIGYAVAPWGSQLGTRTPADSPWAAAVQGLVGALLQGKGYATLAFVFGMALWLAARQRARPEALRRGVVRQQRLLGLGVVHGVFVYFGDILTLYALVGLQLVGRLHLPWGRFRRHLGWALGLALLAKLLMVAAILAYGDQTAAAEEASLALVRSGPAFLELNASTYALNQLVLLLVAAPVMYLCMACGVAAARLRLLTHRRWRPLLQRALWRCGPPLLAVVLVYGLGCALGAPAGAPPWVEVMGDLSAVPMAAVYVVALALWSHGGQARWCHRLAPLGQRTLTLYVGHSVICVAVLSPMQSPAFSQRPRLGLLIDAENSYAAHLPQVMAHVHGYGRPTVLRAYGNWMTPQLTPWKKLMQQHGIQPCQVFQHMKGKNASDIAMVMDMMQLLHARTVDGFCLMSSDGDFSGPAVRVREADLRVYGFGRRETVPTFVAACDAFVYLD